MYEKIYTWFLNYFDVTNEVYKHTLIYEKGLI